MLPGLSEQDRNRAYPWSKRCLDILRSVMPSPLPGSHLMIGSDYSGDHRRSQYRVYTFLLADADSSPNYPDARRNVRCQYLPDGRRMSYKGLNDGVRQHALFPFLSTFDHFDGLCCSFIVHKSLERMATSFHSLSVWKSLHGLNGRWGVPAFEVASRITHFFCLLLGVATRPGQHITWITDQDEIAANDDRLEDVRQLAARKMKGPVTGNKNQITRNKKYEIWLLKKIIVPEPHFLRSL